MRLPEAKIKEAILHPEKMVRQEAVYYFSNCFSPDPAVMPLAIQAIEKYGRRQSFQHVHILADLAQTEATVEWAIRELHREGDFEDRDTYFPALSRLLCNADPRLLVSRALEILKTPGFTPDRTFEFQERLHLLAWDADRCWKELENICTEAVKPDMADFDFGHAHRVVEALARQGDKYTDRILELLGKKIEDFENDPMTWLEIFLVELAGEMRLERAIPLIVAKLHEDGDFLLEECVTALGMIGTDGVAEAITEGWLATEWDYRLYATSALEKIHADTTVRKCLELLPQDKDREIRTKLAERPAGAIGPDQHRTRAADGPEAGLRRFGARPLGPAGGRQPAVGRGLSRTADLETGGRGRAGPGRAADAGDTNANSCPSGSGATERFPGPQADSTPALGSAGGAQ